MSAQATFLYDDCCPLCKGYTAVFEGLGWAEREGFSGATAETLDDLDLDRARHHIPLHDPGTGEVRYGLDGILDVVSANAPVLGRIGAAPAVRTRLDAVYWFITYNRRHIVASAPPASGFDCAPDFEIAAVRRYHGFCGVVAGALAIGSGTELPTAAAIGAAGLLAARRSPTWGINDDQALGHVGTVAMASAAGGAVVKLATGSTRLATVGAVGSAARKLWLRRWMMHDRRGADAPAARRRSKR